MPRPPRRKQTLDEEPSKRLNQNLKPNDISGEDGKLGMPQFIQEIACSFNILLLLSSSTSV